MAIPQTTFPIRMRPAVVGMIANSRPHDSISRICADSAGLAFGIGVFQGAADNQCTATFALAKFVGVTIRDVTLPRTQVDAGSFTDKYKQGENVGIMKEGCIWVQASLAVAAQDPAYITPAGAFTNVSNSGANALIGKWDTSTTAAGLARLELQKK